jgi:hypothetical protein
VRSRLVLASITASWLISAPIAAQQARPRARAHFSDAPLVIDGEIQVTQKKKEVNKAPKVAKYTKG